MTTSHNLHSIKQLDRAAQNRYNHNYDNSLYAKAIEGKSNTYANSLIDEALAICGSPFYKISNRKWSNEAIDFLKKF